MKVCPFCWLLKSYWYIVHNHSHFWKQWFQAKYFLKTIILLHQGSTKYFYGKRSCAKYARIRILSDLYVSVSSILLLYGKSRPEKTCILAILRHAGPIFLMLLCKTSKSINRTSQYPLWLLLIASCIHNAVKQRGAFCENSRELAWKPLTIFLISSS